MFLRCRATNGREVYKIVMKKGMKWIGVILGVLMVILGLYGTFHPVVFFTSLGWLIGLAVMLAGFDGFGAWWAGRKTKAASAWDLVLAILSIVFGVVLLSNLWLRVLTDEVLLMLFGVWIALSGILRIVSAVKLKPKAWGLLVVIGVALIILAIVSLAHPLITALSIGLCVALNFVFQGFNMIFGSFAGEMRRKNRKSRSSSRKQTRNRPRRRKRAPSRKKSKEDTIMINLRKNRGGKAGLARRMLSVFLALVLLAGVLTPAWAYDALGQVTSIVLEKNGRQITYYDIYNGKMDGRTDTDDQTQFYMDVVTQQDNYLKWLNLIYSIFDSKRIPIGTTPGTAGTLISETAITLISSSRCRRASRTTAAMTSGEAAASPLPSRCRMCRCGRPMISPAASAES